MSCPTDAQAGKSVDSFSCIVHQCALKEHDNLFFILRRPYTLSFVSSPRDDVDECVMLQTKEKSVPTLIYPTAVYLRFLHSRGL